MSNNCRQTDFVLGALVGGSLVTLSVMLFSTKKGKQLQRHICDACDDVKDSFLHAKDNIKDKLLQAKDHVEETAQEAKHSAEELGAKAANKIKHDTHHK